MKKLLFIIAIMVAVLTGCEVDNSVDGRIKSALIEYYEPDRIPVLPTVGELDVVHENYEYQSHKILKKAHYGEDVTEYIIEHKYKVDIEGSLNAGMQGIWVNREKENSSYEYQIKELKELKKYL